MGHASILMRPYALCLADLLGPQEDYYWALKIPLFIRWIRYPRLVVVRTKD